MQCLPVVHEPGLPCPYLGGGHLRGPAQGQDRSIALHRLHAVRAGMHRGLHQAGFDVASMSNLTTSQSKVEGQSLQLSAAKAREPINGLIVGVGGQGVIMVSKALAWLAQSRGFEVKQSEVHGMAKRGGSVFSHVRFGPQVWSPTIPKGEADILVALEWAEGLRWLPFLKPDTGIVLCDTKRIVPPFACLNRRPGAPLRSSRE